MSSATQRIIVDASILTAAYGADGEARTQWQSLAGFKVTISPEILIEVEAGLRNGDFHLSHEGIRAALHDILQRCDFVRPAAVQDAKFQNCKEAYLVALARHRHADGVPAGFLLTDQAVCGEKKLGNCQVLTLAEFCRQFANVAAE